MSWANATYLTEAGEVSLLALPVAELVSAGLAAGEDAWYDYAAALHLRADQETFDAAARLCQSSNPTERAYGVDILAKLGRYTLKSDGGLVEVPIEARRFREPVAALILDLVGCEDERDVLRSIAHALGCLSDPRAIAACGRLRAHPDVMVRWAVSCSLQEFAKTDDTALGLLVELTADHDEVIRDWSCFNLHLTGRDTIDVRNALAARLTDDDDITRAEALRAMANLGDVRAVDPLLAALAELDPEDPQADVLLEALGLLAAHTGDVRLSARMSELSALSPME